FDTGTAASIRSTDAAHERTLWHRHSRFREQVYGGEVTRSRGFSPASVDGPKHAVVHTNGAVMNRAIVVSSDGHASMPPELWPQYLEKKYHDNLALLAEQNELSTKTMWILNNLMCSDETFPVFDQEGIWQSGQWKGLWDLDIRMTELERE